MAAPNLSLAPAKIPEMAGRCSEAHSRIHCPKSHSSVSLRSHLLYRLRISSSLGSVFGFCLLCWLFWGFWVAVCFGSLRDSSWSKMTCAPCTHGVSTHAKNKAKPQPNNKQNQPKNRQTSWHARLRFPSRKRFR